MILLQFDQWQNPIPYRLVGQSVWSDQSIIGWAAYEQLPSSLPPPAAPNLPTCQPDPSLLRFQGSTWLGGEPHFLTSYGGVDGYWLISNFQTVHITTNGQEITNLSSTPSSTITSLMSGVGFILALALQGTFCFHASTVAINHQLVAFMGESGKGKSTLGAFLGQMWTQTGDDVLPMSTYHMGRLDFPQPKLLSPKFTELPMQRIYLLAEGELVQLETLSTSHATLSLVRHTIGSRLFAPDLLEQQLAFCAGIAATIPIKKLTYPRQWASLPAVAEAITQDTCL